MSPATSPHHRRRFRGRDPHEDHRVSTPLELLYDLTIVVAFGTAADELAHDLAAGHIGAGVGGFLFAAFATAWAWINYTWFASAYDTDDWVFRLATMVQMVGVIVVSLGIPQMFASLEHGDTLAIGVMVGGYVVMRVALVSLWLQVSRHDPERARTARSYAVLIGLTQVGWVVLAAAGPSVGVGLALAAALIVLEMVVPFVAERRTMTPWHPHHISERYGLLAIITLGEVILGTVAALNAVVHGPQGWSVDAVLLAVAGVGLTFGAWWMYFAVPWGEVLAWHRERAFPFGYGHLIVFAALAAMGAGLHVAAYALEGEAELTATQVVLTTAVPVAIFITMFYLLFAVVWRERDPLHVGLIAGTAVFVAGAIGLAAAGTSVAVALVVLAGAPVVTVIGFEAVGHRHIAAALARQGR